VLFTQEALAAAARGTFAWPRELSGQEVRLVMADHAAAVGVPVSGRGEGRQLDAKSLIAQAAAAGVVLYACPIWSMLLGLQDPLPGMQAIDAAALSSLVQNAKQVVGTL
jgi:hypothetical protein